MCRIVNTLLKLIELESKHKKSYDQLKNHTRIINSKENQTEETGTEMQIEMLSNWQHRQIVTLKQRMPIQHNKIIY